MFCIIGIDTGNGEVVKEIRLERKFCDMRNIFFAIIKLKKFETILNDSTDFFLTKHKKLCHLKNYS
jgi:hypothetical protein